MTQAERIKVIERESEMRRRELHDVMLESDQLRAQLAAIAATEPVAYLYEMATTMMTPGNYGGWVLTLEYQKPCVPDGAVRNLQELFTHPMPAQDVTELVDALKDVAQTLAWMQHGKCRGFSDGLLTTDEALDKARTALSKYKGAK